MTGFVLGLTLTIIIGELPTLLGIPKPSGDLIGVFVRTIQNLDETHAQTAAVGGLALVVLFGGRRIAPRVPWGLVTLVLGVVVSVAPRSRGRGCRHDRRSPVGAPPARSAVHSP